MSACEEGRSQENGSFKVGDIEKEKEIERRLRELGLWEDKRRLESKVASILESQIDEQDGLSKVLKNCRRRRSEGKSVTEEIRNIINQKTIRDCYGQKLAYHVNILMGCFTKDIEHEVIDDVVTIRGATAPLDDPKRLVKELRLELPPSLNYSAVHVSYAAGVVKVRVPFLIHLPRTSRSEEDDSVSSRPKFASISPLYSLNLKLGSINGTQPIPGASESSSNGSSSGLGFESPSDPVTRLSPATSVFASTDSNTTPPVESQTASYSSPDSVFEDEVDGIFTTVEKGRTHGFQKNLTAVEEAATEEESLPGDERTEFVSEENALDQTPEVFEDNLCSRESNGSHETVSKEKRIVLSEDDEKGNKESPADTTYNAKRNNFINCFDNKERTANEGDITIPSTLHEKNNLLTENNWEETDRSPLQTLRNSEGSRGDNSQTMKSLSERRPFSNGTLERSQRTVLDDDFHATKTQRRPFSNGTSERSQRTVLDDDFHDTKTPGTYSENGANHKRNEIQRLKTEEHRIPSGKLSVITQNLSRKLIEAASTQDETGKIYASAVKRKSTGNFNNNKSNETSCDTSPGKGVNMSKVIRDKAILFENGRDKEAYFTEKHRDHGTKMSQQIRDKAAIFEKDHGIDDSTNFVNKHRKNGLTMKPEIRDKAVIFEKRRLTDETHTDLDKPRFKTVTLPVKETFENEVFHKNHGSETCLLNKHNGEGTRLKDKTSEITFDDDGLETSSSVDKKQKSFDSKDGATCGSKDGATCGTSSTRDSAAAFKDCHNKTDKLLNRLRPAASTFQSDTKNLERSCDNGATLSSSKESNHEEESVEGKTEKKWTVSSDKRFTNGLNAPDKSDKKTLEQNGCDKNLFPDRNHRLTNETNTAGKEQLGQLDDSLRSPETTTDSTREEHGNNEGMTWKQEPDFVKRNILNLSRESCTSNEEELNPKATVGVRDQEEEKQLGTGTIQDIAKTSAFKTQKNLNYILDSLEEAIF